MANGEDIPPVEVARWRDAFEEREAEASPDAVETEIARIPLLPDDDVSLDSRRENGDLVIVATGRRFGEHRFPRGPETVDLNRVDPQGGRDPSDGFASPYLPLRPLPRELPRELRLPPRFPTGVAGEDRGDPTAVFAPDSRYTFSDTSFPWCTCGIVNTAAGWGSGVMIGPRHMMTASHVVNWGPNNTAGWMRFTPLRFDDSEPFGRARVTRIYWWNQANGGDGIDADETAFDYVVCVLDRRLGDAVGWMGSRTYSTSWNGGSYWAHVGYPNDLAGGVRPAFIGDGAFDSDFTRTIGGRDSFGLQHKIDVIPGQSGGPFFGWWDGEPWPRVVASQSAENWGGVGGPNTSGGGSPLPELINHARTVEP
jgi:V8-like Glu-specific endopeptidase